MVIDFTKEELDAIVGLMDAGVRASGLQAMRPVVFSVLDKINEAVKAKEPTELTTNAH
jgi:hypothetical protein